MPRRGNSDEARRIDFGATSGGQLLRDQGADVVAVDQPGAALATILGVMPDVLLVDIAMPGLDGVSLIRKLRSLSPERGGRIPAATLSASANTDDEIAHWQAAGFQKHIRKPFPPPAVIAVVEELAGHWVERRAMTRDRCEWPTQRERRREQRTEPDTGFYEAIASLTGPLAPGLA